MRARVAGRLRERFGQSLAHHDLQPVAHHPANRRHGSADQRIGHDHDVAHRDFGVDREVGERPSHVARRPLGRAHIVDQDDRLARALGGRHLLLSPAIEARDQIEGRWTEPRRHQDRRERVVDDQLGFAIHEVRHESMLLPANKARETKVVNSAGFVIRARCARIH